MEPPDPRSISTVTQIPKCIFRNSEYLKKRAYVKHGVVPVEAIDIDPLYLFSYRCSGRESNGDFQCQTTGK